MSSTNPLILIAEGRHSNPIQITKVRQLLVQNDSLTPIHRVSTFMDTLRCKWNGVFYNLVEFKILSRKLIDYKLKNINHYGTGPGEVECSNASDWSTSFPEPHYGLSFNLIPKRAGSVVLVAQGMQLLIGHFFIAG